MKKACRFDRLFGVCKGVLVKLLGILNKRPQTMGTMKPKTAANNKPKASGESQNMFKLPSDIVRARRRFFSICSPNKMPKITGTSGTFSLRKNQPSTPKALIMYRSKVLPEMP